MSKVEAKPKTKVVSFRLSESDIELIDKSGLSASQFIRCCIAENKEAVLSSVLAKRRPSKDKSRLIFFFNKTSNNMNQLALRANIDNKKGVIGTATYNTIISLLSRLESLMERVIKDAD